MRRAGCGSGFAAEEASEPAAESPSSPRLLGRLIHAGPGVLADHGNRLGGLAGGVLALQSEEFIFRSKEIRGWKIEHLAFHGNRRLGFHLPCG